MIELANQDVALRKVNLLPRIKQLDGFRWNKRTKVIISMGIAITFISFIVLASLFTPEISSQLASRNLSPSWQHIFGTDTLGRDMFARTMKGLTLSLSIGSLASIASVCIALILAFLLASFDKKIGSIVSYMIDLWLSLPPMITLILLSFTIGGGKRGIVIAMALTHWPGLARLLRSEILQIKSKDYIQMSKGFGKSRFFITIHHILPHLVHQFFIGLVLLFPHIILHEASLTFLGFGLPPHEPAIGTILSESMKYLSIGMWWLAFFPGCMLFFVVWAGHSIGNNMRMLIDPFTAHE